MEDVKVIISKEKYEQLLNVFIEKEMYKKRIEKAIEYIEIIQYNESYGVKEKDYLELLDILQGSGKE